MEHTAIYNEIKERIAYYKRSFPYHTREGLYECIGAIKMASKLGAITIQEALELDRLAIREGINNPDYFERG